MSWSLNDLRGTSWRFKTTLTQPPSGGFDLKIQNLGSSTPSKPITIEGYSSYGWWGVGSGDRRMSICFNTGSGNYRNYLQFFTYQNSYASQVNYQDLAGKKITFAYNSNVNLIDESDNFLTWFRANAYVENTLTLRTLTTTNGIVSTDLTMYVNLSSPSSGEAAAYTYSNNKFSQLKISNPATYFSGYNFPGKFLYWKNEYNAKTYSNNYLRMSIGHGDGFNYNQILTAEYDTAFYYHYPISENADGIVECEVYYYNGTEFQKVQPTIKNSVGFTTSVYFDSSDNQFKEEV